MLGTNREPGCGTVAPEALQQARASDDAAVQVEGRDRAARPLPVAAGAGHQHHRAREALHQPRGDNADNALVPVLAGDHVGAPAPLRFGPGLDLLNSVAQDPVLDYLALAVQLLEPPRLPVRLLLVLAQQ